MAYPIKFLVDKEGTKFIPYTNSQSVLIDGTETKLQDILNIKLDPIDVKAGSDIKVTPTENTTTVAWVRPTNLTVQNNLTTTAAGKGVLDAYQGKLLKDEIDENFSHTVLTESLGQPNGVATLGNDGKVPSGQLPAYVDDVVEAYIISGQTALSKTWLTTTNGSTTALTPETGKIYVIMSPGSYQNKQYRWGGSTYVLCNPSDVNSVNGMTGVITLKTLTVKTAAGQANTVNETFNASADKTVTINVPSKTSHITNDSGFITSAADITGNAATATTADKTKGTLTIKMKNYDNNTETTDTFNGNADKTITIGVPTKVSQLENDSQFITSSASITGNAATATTATTATKTQGTLTIKMKNYDTDTETTDSFNGYENKTITIGVPTKLSQLDNDKGFITSVPQASTTVSGTIKIGTGLAMGTNGAVYVTGEGVNAQSVDWENVSNKPTYITDWKDYITADSDITGNANTATTLQTARTINGTSFNGSQNITTANWGTARNISISDNDGTNTGTAVSVNGSKAVTLKLPATIKASLSGNATTATTATTANKTKGTITIQKNGAKLNTFDGSADVTVNVVVPTDNLDIDNGRGFITSSGSITGNAGSATKLATARNITLDTAVSATATSFNGTADITIPVTSVKESYLTWGGKNLVGEVTPIGASLSSEHSANRLAFLNPAALTIEYSNDGGSTWTDAGLTNEAKVNFVTTSTGIGVGSASTVTTNHRTRVLLTAQNGTTGYVYTRPRKMLLNVSTAGHGLRVTVEYKTGVSGASWKTLGTYELSGWSGWNDIPLGLGTLGGGTTQTGNNWYLRLTFATTSVHSSYTTTKSSLISMRIFGDTSWTSPSTMATTGHLYTYDYQQNAAFPNGLSAKSFTEDGTALSSKYAAKSHTHNYAGSSSAGGAANSVKTNLVIKLNGGSTEGTNLFTFNGSTAKTVNITASGIGAAASSHTHNYAGSSSAGGAANSTKASLTLTKNRSDVSFNGSAAQTVTIPTVHTGPGVPAASLGQDGDIYIVTG